MRNSTVCRHRRGGRIDRRSGRAAKPGCHHRSSRTSRTASQTIAMTKNAVMRNAITARNTPCDISLGPDPKRGWPGMWARMPSSSERMRSKTCMSGAPGGIGADRFRQPVGARQSLFGVHHESSHSRSPSRIDHRPESVASLCDSASRGEDAPSPNCLLQSKERRRLPAHGCHPQRRYPC